MLELILIRGLPGSGKSTFAETLLHLYNSVIDGDADWNMDYSQPRWFHYEADMFFIGISGKYQFDPSIIPDAHMWCQLQCHKVLSRGDSVIVSNTFSRIWEMQPYLDMAKEFGAKLTVIECQGNYGSVHNVPEETILKMKQRWEKYPNA